MLRPITILDAPLGQERSCDTQNKSCTVRDHLPSVTAHYKTSFTEHTADIAVAVTGEVE